MTAPEPVHLSDTVTIYCGDCMDVLPTLEGVDAVVTDPPYGLSFMGKDWDHGVPGVHFWTEALRVAKPGAHLLAFGGTRTFHRLAVAIEDAGWEIRDCIMWVYGSGFPKSLDVSKAIDKAAGAEREVVGTKHGLPGYSLTDGEVGGVAMSGNVDGSLRHGEAECAITAPATYAARQWSGWGTALKPAWEPIIVARKPLAGTVAENVQRYGTGAMNVDGCRVDANGEKTGGNGYIGLRQARGWNANNMPYKREQEQSTTQGRFPANLIHDGSEEVVRLFPQNVKGQVGMSKTQGGHRFIEGDTESVQKFDYGSSDSGSAARFFYCAKASKADRGEDNRHPTVKPTDLMSYLCRLVTQPGGVVLDPFMGSGSTGKAAATERFSFIGMELNPEYAEMARGRIADATAQLRLPL